MKKRCSNTLSGRDRVRRIICVCLLLLLGLGLFGNFTPQANTTVSGNTRYVTEIGAFTNLFSVDVDSEGRVFVLADNDVYRSTDHGETWTKVLDKVTASAPPQPIFIDSNDYIHVVIYVFAHYYQIYRSTNNGNTWSNTTDYVPKIWHMDEAPNGYLYAQTYSGGTKVYRSINSGESWSDWFDVEETYGRQVVHQHSGRVNPYTGEYFLSVEVNYGYADTWILKWNGTWNVFFNRTGNYPLGAGWGPPTDFIFDSDYIYFLPDWTPEITYRLPHNAQTWNPEQDEQVWNGHFANGEGLGVSFYGVVIDDMLLIGTVGGHLWGSWDGKRWVKIAEFTYGDGGGSGISWISQRKPIYFVDMRAHTRKLYRIDITKEDLIQLYYTEWYLRRGSLTNAENYVLEKRIWNGTNYIDLTRVALTNVQASIKGLSRKNWFTNSGFETGDKTGWSEMGLPYGVIKSDTPANSTYYYARNHTSTTSYLRQNSFVSGSFGDIYLISFYVKANASQTDALQLRFAAGNGSLIKTTTIDVTTSWKRVIEFWVLGSGFQSARWEIRFLNDPLETHLDSLMLIRAEVGIFRSDLNIEGISFWEGTTGSYHEILLNTTNPTLTISGQTVSYSGTLTNGTESPATSLSGIFTGAVRIDANIQGSGQAILRITGTRVLYEDSIILKGRKDNVYYGRYYGTFSPTVTTNDLIAVTNLASNITSLSYSSDKLTLTINAPSGTTSTTKVYCGDKGEPTAVYATNGTLTWSHNASTKILTLNVVHDGPANILVDWKIPGDVNGDGKVDYSDLFDLSEAYGSNSSKPKWNPDCDFNRDGVVDVFDLSIVGKNYGKTS